MNNKEINILIVDDDELCLDILTEYLDIDGCIVTTNNNGAEALMLIEKNPSMFDLIVLDRKLPGLDGLQLIKELRSNDKTKHLPIIMQTGMATKENESEALCAGANLCLSKPFTRFEFTTGVNQLLNPLLLSK